MSDWHDVALKEWSSDHVVQWIKSSLRGKFPSYIKKILENSFDGSVLIACVDKESILDLIFEGHPIKDIFLVKLKAEIERQEKEGRFVKPIIAEDLDKLIATPISSWGSSTVIHWLITHPEIGPLLDRHEIANVCICWHKYTNM